MNHHYLLRTVMVGAFATLLTACDTPSNNPADTQANTQNATASQTTEAKPVVAAASVNVAEVRQQYVAIAQANYSDALAAAKVLDQAIQTLLQNPTDETLTAARQAWIAARVPYQQTEAYRFGNPAVDAWEGKVNAWPLDEGLIDYVAASYGTSEENPWYSANVIANPTLTIGGKTVDATNITPALLSDTLQEIDAVESNVATGYHAIEFLLWGQDLNGTKPGAGQRPATDYSLSACSNGNCERRRAYLSAASALLIKDLEDIVASWSLEGEALKEFAAKSDAAALASMLTGMGSLSYGELAGERIKLGLMLHDPEEEHDCFSDNTHWSHYYDAQGIQNVYIGSYTRTDGSTVTGTSLSALVKAKDAALDAQMLAALAKTQAAMNALVDEAGNGNTVDVLIGSGNTAGNAVIQNVVDALVGQTRVIEKIITALELGKVELEGSDSLDNPSAI
jgi:putative iron-regulated protein